MYPNLYYFFRSVFGLELPALQIFNTFGFFVALSFGICTWLLRRELKRRESAGDIPYQVEEIEIGQKVNYQQVAIQAFLGFLFAWKIVGAMLDADVFQQDISGYIFSMQGSWIAGLIGGILSGYDKYRSMKKAELPEVRQQKVKVYPSDKIGEIVLVLGISGFVGAKVFNALETWEDFVQDPVASLLSGSGLTFLGGLIFATIALYVMMRRMKVNFWVFADTLAPIMLLAYAIGRMGCLFAGDGDWGVYNAAYYHDPETQLTELAPPDAFDTFARANQNYFYRSGEPQSRYYVRPTWLSFLPLEFFAYTFPHNVNNDGYPLPDCQGRYCAALPWPVFPTPAYEILMSFLAFGLLWSRRKRFQVPGMILGAYMILAGIERYLIEGIRVNYRYDLGVWHPSQAEILSILMVLGGLLFMWRLGVRSEILKNE